jgi:hypothetical protein
MAYDPSKKIIPALKAWHRAVRVATSLSTANAVNFNTYLPRPIGERGLPLFGLSDPEIANGIWSEPDDRAIANPRTDELSMIDHRSQENSARERST